MKISVTYERISPGNKPNRYRVSSETWFYSVKETTAYFAVMAALRKEYPEIKFSITEVENMEFYVTERD